jgi:hypothetical protein
VGPRAALAHQPPRNDVSRLVPRAAVVRNTLRRCAKPSQALQCVRDDVRPCGPGLMRSHHPWYARHPIGQAVSLGTITAAAISSTPNARTGIGFAGKVRRVDNG